MKKNKIDQLHRTANEAIAKLTAETRLRQEMKLRRMSDAEIGAILVSGSDEMKMIAQAALTERRKQHIAERMGEVTLHPLCVIFFEQKKEKKYGGYEWDYTHKNDERMAAQAEIHRRIKKPEVGALSDHSEAQASDDPIDDAVDTEKTPATASLISLPAS